MNRVHLVGIVNLTPDSFSDGGMLPSLEAQLAHARGLLEGGAAIIDIGGDSTRPGSICTGIEEEWRRIEPLVTKLAREAPVSVDTHHPEVARRALDSGALYINDVSGGRPEMFELVARYSAKIIVVYSRCSRPHLFDRPIPKDLFGSIKEFFIESAALAERSGLARGRVLFDPGMGGFVSDDPRDSFKILQGIKVLEEFSPLVIGISRKGFLKFITDEPARERDAVSAFLARRVAERLQPHDVFLRVHNPKLHREFLTL